MTTPNCDTQNLNSQAAMLFEYHLLTIPNPLLSIERIHKSTLTVVNLTPAMSEDAIILESIRTTERGEGNGSKCLRWICDLADKHGVILRLQVHPFGNIRPRLNYWQLKRWYARHGFVNQPRTRGKYMERKPQQTVASKHTVVHHIDVGEIMPNAVEIIDAAANDFAEKMWLDTFPGTSVGALTGTTRQIISVAIHLAFKMGALQGVKLYKETHSGALTTQL